MNNIYIVIFVLLIIFVGFIWVTRTSSKNNTNQNICDSQSTDPLLHVDNTTSPFFTIYTRKL